jgi:hypothetical protein
VEEKKGSSRLEAGFQRSAQLSSWPSASRRPLATSRTSCDTCVEMDDLTSIKESLVTETSSLLTLLTNSLDHSESDVETANLLESFWEVLDGDGIKGEERALRMVKNALSSCHVLIERQLSRYPPAFPSLPLSRTRPSPPPPSTSSPFYPSNSPVPHPSATLHPKSSFKASANMPRPGRS